MKLTLGLDIDDVVLKYKKHLLIYAKKAGLNPQKRHDEEHGFDLKDIFHGCSSDNIIQIIESFSKTNEFSQIEEMDGFTNALNKIRDVFKDIRIVAITSAGKSDRLIKLRNLNLAKYNFHQISILPLGASKRSHLMELPKGAVYIDDNYTHVKTAHELSLNAILFESPTNKSDKHHTMMKCWNRDLDMVIEQIDKQRAYL